MKKKIYLILTIIISLFMFSGSVEAAKELTCIYKGGLQDDSKMLVQNSAGELFVFTNMKDSTNIDDANWYNPKDDFKVTIKFSSTKYDQSTGLSSCPSWSRAKKSVYLGNDEGYEYIFLFADSKDFWKLDYERVSEQKGLPNLDVYVTFTKDKFLKYQVIIEEIENSENYAKCTYGPSDHEKYLYFNEKQFVLIDSSNLVYSSAAKFTLKELWSVSNGSTYTSGCPLYLYQENAMPTVNKVDNFYYNYYLHDSGGLFRYGKYDLVEHEGNLTLTEPEPEITIDDCEDLFGVELIDKINDIMNVIKIAIPILLIAFGIIDFTKAIFSGSEEDMAKSQKIFLKRLLAAILVFFSPILINLILSLANEVWGVVSPDTCIK